jgi:hypothetical protein
MKRGEDSLCKKGEDPHARKGEPTEHVGWTKNVKVNLR